LEESAVEGAYAGAACGNEGTVNIEEEQLHAAILRERESFLCFQKYFRVLCFHLDLQTTLRFLTNKAQTENQE
jgi:hypothetical protein